MLRIESIAFMREMDGPREAGIIIYGSHGMSTILDKDGIPLTKVHWSHTQEGGLSIDISTIMEALHNKLYPKLTKQVLSTVIDKIEEQAEDLHSEAMNSSTIAVTKTYAIKISQTIATLTQTLKSTLKDLPP